MQKIRQKTKCTNQNLQIHESWASESFNETFIEPQFAYCPLVWMYCDKTPDTCINHLHERALKTVYNDNVSTLEKLLEKYNSVTIHVRNLGILATDLYKAKQNLAAPIVH